MGVNYNPSQVTEGLVLYFDAANSRSYPRSGTVWNDLSGATYTGSLINGPTFSAENFGSFNFDGSNDYVGIPSPSSRWSWTPSGSGLNNVTFELWTRSSDTDGNYVSKPWNGNGEYNYRIVHNALVLQIGAQSNSFAFSSIATGNWTQVCVVVSSTQFGAYINGTLNVALSNHGITNNTPSSGNADLDLCLMTLYPYGAGGWDIPGFSVLGNTALFKIYNRVLNANEVAQNFNALRGRFGI